MICLCFSIMGSIRLIDWLMDWWIDGLIDWLIDCSIDFRFSLRMIDWLPSLCWNVSAEFVCLNAILGCYPICFFPQNRNERIHLELMGKMIRVLRVRVDCSSSHWLYRSERKVHRQAALYKREIAPLPPTWRSVLEHWMRLEPIRDRATAANLCNNVMSIFRVQSPLDLPLPSAWKRQWKWKTVVVLASVG